MNILKWVGTAIAFLSASVVLLLIATAIHHHIQLKKESKKYAPRDRMVEVDGTKMQVYLEGQGEITLVFMSGHGTISPVLDFKPIWEKMVDEYRIAVVERPGYGWSAPSNRSRDVNTVLEETREALERAGEKGPYVLLPHSMSGIEAIYWAQKYPDEVKAIIGLDACTPEACLRLPKPEKIQLNLMYFISRIGLTRFMSKSQLEGYYPLLTSSLLSDEGKSEYLAVFYRTAYSKNMLQEVDGLLENANRVDENGPPRDTPMCFFISREQSTAVEGWKDALMNYVSEINNAKYMLLDAKHYVHYDKAEIITTEAKKFLGIGSQ